MQTLKIKRALLSVSNKEGIIGFAKGLVKNHIEIISTGGTAKKLQESGIPFTPIEQVTGNPEAFSGRMKTISFQVASGLLFRRDSEADKKQAKELGIAPIDLVVCNLYPFREALDQKLSHEELIENIDVGGPTMIRAAAKNYYGVAVCTFSAQYAQVLQEIEVGGITLKTREKLAAYAFRLLASYDSLIADTLGEKFLEDKNKTLHLVHGRELRYGENPHQQAVFYRLAEASHIPSIASATIVQGKALSYNNLLDADAAHRAASDVLLVVKKSCAVAIVKHLNPCGLASAPSNVEALELAWAGDPISAFGGVLCFTHEVDIESARWLEDKFIEVIVAPSFSPDALQSFAKKKNLRILLCPPKQEKQETMLRSVSGGLLVQDEDLGLDDEIRSVTKNKFPDENNMLAHFGIIAAKQLKSNAIALVRKQGKALQLVGAGMGQPNRVDSLKLLAGPRAQAKGKLSEMLLVSDAFFPFSDIIEEAAKLGIKQIIQPGGSIRDQEVIDCCNQHGITMAFTGRRHFRH